MDNTVCHADPGRSHSLTPHLPGTPRPVFGGPFSLQGSSLSTSPAPVSLPPALLPSALTLSWRERSCPALRYLRKKQRVLLCAALPHVCLKPSLAGEPPPAPWSCCSSARVFNLSMERNQTEPGGEASAVLEAGPLDPAWRASGESLSPHSLSAHQSPEPSQAPGTQTENHTPWCLLSSFSRIAEPTVLSQAAASQQGDYTCKVLSRTGAAVRPTPGLQHDQDEPSPSLSLFPTGRMARPRC